MGITERGDPLSVPKMRDSILRFQRRFSPTPLRKHHTTFARTSQPSTHRNGLHTARRTRWRCCYHNRVDAPPGKAEFRPRAATTVGAALGLTVFVANEFHRPATYHLPWEIRASLVPTVLVVRFPLQSKKVEVADMFCQQGLISTSWGTANLFRGWKMRVLMPPLVAVIMHAGLAWFFLTILTQGALGLLESQEC